MLKRYATAIFLLLLGLALLAMACAAVHWTFVLERTPSFAYLAGMTTTLLLLAVFGLGTLYAAWRCAADARPKPATSPRGSRAYTGVFFTWVAVTFILLLSAPLIFYGWDGIPDPNAAIALVIPFIALLGALWALRQTLVYRRTGEWTLQFHDVPLIGQALRGSLRFHKGPQEAVYRLLLRCEQTLGKGEDTISNNLHEETQNLRPLGDMLTFDFVLPDYAVGSHQANYPPRWSLEIMPESGETSRKFYFDVEAPQGEEAVRTQLRDDARAAQVIAADAAVAIPADLAVIQRGINNFRLSYSPRRHDDSERTLYVMAGVMAAIAAILWIVDVGPLASVIFIFFAGCFGLGGYLAGWQLLNVFIDDGLMRVEERGRLLGGVVAVACKEIERIEVRVTMQSTTGRRVRYQYGIDAVLRNDTRLNVGDGIHDPAVAHALVARLAEAVGPHVRKGDVDAAVAAHGVMVLRKAAESEEWRVES